MLPHTYSSRRPATAPSARQTTSNGSSQSLRIPSGPHVPNVKSNSLNVPGPLPTHPIEPDVHPLRMHATAPAVYQREKQLVLPPSSPPPVSSRFDSIKHPGDLIRRHITKMIVERAGEYTGRLAVKHGVAVIPTLPQDAVFHIPASDDKHSRNSYQVMLADAITNARENVPRGERAVYAHADEEKATRKSQLFMDLLNDDASGLLERAEASVDKAKGKVPATPSPNDPLPQELLKEPVCGENVRNRSLRYAQPQTGLSAVKVESKPQTNRLGMLTSAASAGHLAVSPVKAAIAAYESKATKQYSVPLPYPHSPLQPNFPGEVHEQLKRLSMPKAHGGPDFLGSKEITQEKRERQRECTRKFIEGSRTAHKQDTENIAKLKSAVFQGSDGVRYIDVGTPLPTPLRVRAPFSFHDIIPKPSDELHFTAPSLHSIKQAPRKSGAATRRAAIAPFSPPLPVIHEDRAFRPVNLKSSSTAAIIETYAAYQPRSELRQPGKLLPPNKIYTSSDPVKQDIAKGRPDTEYRAFTAPSDDVKEAALRKAQHPNALRPGTNSLMSVNIPVIEFTPCDILGECPPTPVDELEKPIPSVGKCRRRNAMSHLSFTDEEVQTLKKTIEQAEQRKAARKADREVLAAQPSNAQLTKRKPVPVRQHSVCADPRLHQDGDLAEQRKAYFRKRTEQKSSDGATPLKRFVDQENRDPAVNWSRAERERRRAQTLERKNK